MTEYWRDVEDNGRRASIVVLPSRLGGCLFCSKSENHRHEVNPETWEPLGETPRE